MNTCLTICLPALLTFFATMAASALHADPVTLTGDHVIEPGQNDTGSLTVSGQLHVESNHTDLGTTGDGRVALQLNYEENGEIRQTTVYATRESVAYLWKEGSADAAVAKLKMSLGADNTLTLHDATGTGQITLTPSSGEISASGGFRLPDGTLLTSNPSLPPAGGVIAGGYHNPRIGNYSVILGGTSNSTTGDVSAIAGGSSNTATSMYVFMGGGFRNTVQATGSAIVGGSRNAVHEEYAFIAGGVFNDIYGSNSFIAGGYLNEILGSDSFIAGGRNNTVSGSSSSSLGSRNTAKASNAIVIGDALSGNAQGMIVVGRHNKPQGTANQWIETDDLFVVGNGSGELRENEFDWGGGLAGGVGAGSRSSWNYENGRNAFAIHKNANMRSGGTFEAKGGIRIPPGGDIPMGAFTQGNDPRSLDAGLRYEGE